jgi:hypothetical protein
MHNPVLHRVHLNSRFISAAFKIRSGLGPGTGRGWPVSLLHPVAACAWTKELETEARERRRRRYI